MAFPAFSCSVAFGKLRVRSRDFWIRPWWFGWMGWAVWSVARVVDWDRRFRMFCCRVVSSGEGYEQRSQANTDTFCTHMVVSHLVWLPARQPFFPSISLISELHLSLTACRKTSSHLEKGYDDTGHLPWHFEARPRLGLQQIAKSLGGAGFQSCRCRNQKFLSSAVG